MKKTLLFTILIAVWISLHAQNNMDSAWAIWNDKTAPDTSRAQAMNKIAWDGYLFSQPDSAFYYAKLMYDFAKKKSLKREMAIALSIQGVSYTYRSNYPQGLKYYQQSLRIYEKISNKAGIANIFNNIGLIYEYQGNYPKALDYYQRSLTIKGEISDKKGMANTLNNIGGIYRYQGDYPKALDYYQQCLMIDMEMRNKRGIATTLMNIGNIYIDQDNNSKGLEYYQRSLKIHEEISNKREIANILNNIGSVYLDQDNYSLALEYYKRSLMIKEEISDKKGIAHTMNNIGNTNNNQGDHEQAIIWCKKGLQIAEEINITVAQQKACQCLYDAYKSIGKGNEALAYYEKMNILNDSLQAKETSRKLQQMEFQKELLADSIIKEKEKLKIQHTHELEIQKKNRIRNISIVSGFFLVVIAIGLFRRLRYIRKSKALIEKEKDRSENLLLNILPAEIAEELKEKGRADARNFDSVSIIFTDFHEFTKKSASLSAHELVTEINTCYEAFDQIIGKYGIEKIKTIGDSYMAAGGLPVPSKDSVTKTVQVALELQAFIIERKKEKLAKKEAGFEMRVGIHTGPVVAGIVGVKKFQYDVWGDTVNIASRMEVNGEVDKVNISIDTYKLIKENPMFTFESRGKINVKGKGEMEMYYVSRSFSEG